jgi:hypothetical protein
MHHRPDLGLVLFLVALCQADIAQVLETLRSAVGSDPKTARRETLTFR